MSSSSSTRVFVRRFDGATGREGEEELLMLPPPPLVWKNVVAAMIQAVRKRDEAHASSRPSDDEIARARLFLLPTDAQGIVGEMNARALRFGVRDNDKFAICLHGEEYQAPSAGTAATTPAASTASTTSVPSSGPSSSVSTTGSTMSSSLPNVMVTALKDHSAGPPRGNMMMASSAAPPGGSIMMNGGNTGGGGLLAGGRKGNKRFRSISGKMAAIKSLGDKGLISVEDRGHLKDLLLNNDSPALQEALDKYQSTGDFQAVKALLTHELQNPSQKRGTGDWISESLINDISMNFNTQDDDQVTPTHSGNNTYGRPPPGPHTPSNPFMYHQSQGQSAGTSSTATASPSTSEYASMSMPSGDSQQQQQRQQQSGGSASSTPYNTTPQQGMSWSNTAPNTQTNPSGGVYAQPTMMPMQSPAAAAAMYGSQINLPLRNRNSINLMLKQRGLDGTPSGSMMVSSEMGYVAATPAAGYAMAPGYSQVAYGQHPEYARVGMTPYGMTPVAGGGYAYSPYQQQATYGVPAYGYGAVMHPGMQGYDYYGAGGGFGYTKQGGRGGGGGKWAQPPPMPSYPPPCSKEEKKEKIARWLKKRENRNWSNKPSYPVRHNIAKNRKRGEDGRFITKARLAEMAAEDAARAAAGGAGGGEGGLEDDNGEPLGYLDANLLGMPTMTPVHM